jgi:hypothetical protein
VIAIQLQGLRSGAALEDVCRNNLPSYPKSQRLGYINRRNLTSHSVLLLLVSNQTGWDISRFARSYLYHIQKWRGNPRHGMMETTFLQSIFFSIFCPAQRLLSLTFSNLESRVSLSVPLSSDHRLCLGVPSLFSLSPTFSSFGSPLSCRINFSSLLAQACNC